MAKFNEFRNELLPHPAYSPDLAPCDYFLFLNLKKFGGKRFTTREQLIVETEAYFLVGFSSRSYYGITNLSVIITSTHFFTICKNFNVCSYIESSFHFALNDNTVPLLN